MVRLFLSILLLLSTSAAMAAEEQAFERIVATKTINCGYFVWPPYISLDPNTKKLSGINYDIMEAIGKNLGLKINWVMEVGVGEVTTALQTNKFDVMCASIWASPARTQVLTFTNPTFYSDVYAFSRSGDNRFDEKLNKANIATVKVTGIEGDYTADMATELLPSAQKVFLPSTASGSELMLQLASKKADIVFSDKSLINDFSLTNPNQVRLVEGIGAVRTYGEPLSVKSGEYRLRDMLNIAILQLTNDGVLDKIVKKYVAKYHGDMYPPAKTISRVAK